MLLNSKANKLFIIGKHHLNKMTKSLNNFNSNLNFSFKDKNYPIPDTNNFNKVQTTNKDKKYKTSSNIISEIHINTHPINQLL